MKNLRILLIIIVALVSCNTVKKNITVEKITDVKNLRTNSIYYFLPKTKIKIDVTIQKEIFKKGIFSSYSRKYLGTNSFPDSINYILYAVKFTEIPVADSANLFVINYNSTVNLSKISFTPDGFLFGFNVSNYNMYGNVTLPEETTYEYFLQEQNKVYDIENVAFISKEMINKSSDEQAENIANLIFSIRDDKKALLNGDAKSTDGQSVRFMYDNLCEMENKYLALFQGCRIVENETHTFYFEPEELKTVYQKILFRFSASEGILPTNNLRGLPVFLEISATELTNKIYNYQVDQQSYKRKQKLKEVNYGLKYRIPQSAVVKLVYNGADVNSKNIMLPQYGVIAELPAEIALDENVAIEFYPATGAIKNIYKKEKAN